LIPDNELEERYQRWKANILKNIGFADDKVLRYIWALYDELMIEIKNLNNKINKFNNGKT
jgi:hypothetical protein